MEVSSLFFTSVVSFLSRVELLQHIGGAILHLLDVTLEQLVQQIHTSALWPPTVVGSAGISRLQISPAHREHRSAAVSAYRKAGIDILVFFDAPVIAAGAVLALLLRLGENTVVHNGRVVILKDDVVDFVLFHIRVVNLFAGILALV